MLENNTRIVIRCNNIHKTEWEENAKKAGLTLSDYVRVALKVIVSNPLLLKQYK